MPVEPSIPISVDGGTGFVRIRADLSRRPEGLLSATGPWRESVELRIEGGEVSTDQHRFDQLWWAPAIRPDPPLVDEYERPLFPGLLDGAVARETWRRMFNEARPFLDGEALRLTYVTADVQRLYEALAFEPSLRLLVRVYRPAGVLLAYHRTFRLRDGESLETGFSRLVLEANPVARSYIPMIREALVPCHQPLPPFFLAWARTVRFTPRWRPFNSATLTGATEWIYAALEASPAHEPAMVARLRERRAAVLFGEAVIRRSTVSEAVLADPNTAVAAVENFATERGGTDDWALACAGYVGSLE